MPSRIATGPVTDPERVKGLILADPSIVEEGLRVLDVDLSTGSSGTIDIAAADSAGSLTLIALCADAPDAALLRLVDAYGWATEQRDLLGRLYAAGGMVAGRPLRCLLLASSFTHAFLRRLGFLSIAVSPYVVLARATRGEATVRVEPAAPIFGLPSGALAAEAEPYARAGGARDAAPTGSTQRADEPALDAEVLDAASPLPEAPAPDDESDDVFADLPELQDPGAAPSPPFEVLTTEEMEEFERFDRQRRDRVRRSS